MILTYFSKVALFLFEDILWQKTFNTSPDSIEEQNRRLYVECIDYCYITVNDFFLYSFSNKCEN